MLEYLALAPIFISRGILIDYDNTAEQADERGLSLDPHLGLAAICFCLLLYLVGTRAHCGRMTSYKLGCVTIGVVNGPPSFAVLPNNDKSPVIGPRRQGGSTGSKSRPRPRQESRAEIQLGKVREMSGIGCVGMC
jgi:hypothetical protein